MNWKEAKGTGSWMLLALTVAFTTCASPVAAQEKVIPLDTVTVDASSRASSELATPTRAVQVVTASEINELGARSIGDVLEWMAAADLMARSPASADLSLRGSTFEQVLVLVDGVRMSDTQTGHFDLDLAVPVAQIERIEVLRGAGSALHGSGAVGGVINVVTRSSSDGVGGQVEFGSFETAGGSLTAGFSLGASDVDVAGEHRRSEGHRDGTEYRITQLRTSTTVPLRVGALRAHLGHASRDFGADGFYAPFPSREATETTTATVRLQASDASDFAFEPLLSVRRHTDDFILDRHDPSFSRNQHTSWQTGVELPARWRLSQSLSLAGGIEVYHDRLTSNSLGEREETRGAAVLEVAGGRPGELSGSAGLRGDWHSTYGTVLSPSASAAWWPVAGLRVRTSAGTAFRAPTWTERYYRDPANIGDPDLDPERSWSAEIGADAVLPAGFVIGAGTFFRHAHDLIDWAKPEDALDEPWITRNVEDARFRGVELMLGIPDVAGVRMTLRGEWLSFSTSESAGFVSKSALRPLLESLSIQASRDLTDRLALMILARQMRRTSEETHHRIDLKSSYDFGRLRVHADLRNATDALYLDVTGMPAAGRALYLGIELMRTAW